MLSLCCIVPSFCQEERLPACHVLQARGYTLQVRRDNPRLTTRREGGHAPARIVMSRTLDLPQVCASDSTPRAAVHATECVPAGKESAGFP